MKISAVNRNEEITSRISCLMSALQSLSTSTEITLYPSFLATRPNDWDLPENNSRTCSPFHFGLPRRRRPARDALGISPAFTAFAVGLVFVVLVARLLVDRRRNAWRRGMFRAAACISKREISWSEIGGRLSSVIVVVAAQRTAAGWSRRRGRGEVFVVLPSVSC